MLRKNPLCHLPDVLPSGNGTYKKQYDRDPARLKFLVKPDAENRHQTNGNGWAGNNNSDGYQPRSGASRYYAGRIWQGWSESTPYAIMNIDGESKKVYVPFLQGSAVDTQNYTTGALLGGYRLTETASWVSTPVTFSSVMSNFKDKEMNIQYYWYNGDQLRRTEIFYWYYKRSAYSDKVQTRWQIADQSIHQIRFGGNVWMNEPGANKNNAVNVFMVKERSTDTCSDEYHQLTQ